MSPDHGFTGAVGIEMPKGKSTKPTPGQRVEVHHGVAMPEFPDLSIGGWTGKVLETSGSGSKLKVILEWDESTLERMPESYRSHCESQGLVFAMACLPASELQTIDAG
jgi:hypothetical protein